MILIGIVVLALLLFLRFFWVLIRWEVRWDMRLLEFGMHAFLPGVLLSLAALVYKGLLVL